MRAVTARVRLVSPRPVAASPTQGSAAQAVTESRRADWGEVPAGTEQAFCGPVGTGATR